MIPALRPVVLTLHHTPAGAALAPTAIGIRAVRRIVGDMRARGYRFVGSEACGPEGPPPGTACLTVDDGYDSTARHLAPLLRELAIPWTVFVLVGPMGRANRWDLPWVGPRERHLAPEEVRGLAEEGVTIGSHGMEHHDLRRLGDRALGEALANSRAALEDLTGRAVRAVAYPRGAVNARVAQAARSAGYRLGFASARERDLPPPIRRFAIARAALYAPDQIPGLFEWTALRGPRALARGRGVLAGIGDALIVVALAARDGARGMGGARA